MAGTKYRTRIVHDTVGHVFSIHRLTAYRTLISVPRGPRALAHLFRSQAVCNGPFPGIHGGFRNRFAPGPGRGHFLVLVRQRSETCFRRRRPDPYS